MLSLPEDRSKGLNYKHVAFKGFRMSWKPANTIYITSCYECLSNVYVESLTVKKKGIQRGRDVYKTNVLRDNADKN